MAVPAIGAHRREAPLMRVAEPAALLQFALVALAFAALTYAFVVSDFSVKLVYDNSHSAKPLIYKVSGVWGNHEGSMVLWVLILALFGALVALFGNNLPDTLRARVLAVQASIAVAFLLFILFTSNPFLRLDPAPFEGQGLNPILQDRALAFHPPWALCRLCRLLDDLLVCRRGADRRPRRCELGALGPALDARRLALAHHRHRHGVVVGLLHARLGRFLVLGPGWRTPP